MSDFLSRSDMANLIGFTPEQLACGLIEKSESYRRFVHMQRRLQEKAFKSESKTNSEDRIRD